VFGYHLFLAGTYDRPTVRSMIYLSMKNYLKVIIILIIIIALGALVYFYNTKSTLSEQPPITSGDKIEGCYVATLGKDVYSLKILSQNGEEFKGTLVFKNFQKDSSSGQYNGTYKDGILLGEYSFDSEGMHSVMQVAFKKYGKDFIRGFEDVEVEGTRFVDINKITYDPSVIFKASVECATLSL